MKGWLKYLRDNAIDDISVRAIRPGIAAICTVAQEALAISIGGVAGFPQPSDGSPSPPDCMRPTLALFTIGTDAIANSAGAASWKSSGVDSAGTSRASWKTTPPADEITART